ncbi:hypothetical protein CMI47_13735 [Candidatus Pacearchaeota archaeon]|nr:hypothetical protein [Candidatus Pacearchaeota archaeon]
MDLIWITISIIFRYIKHPKCRLLHFVGQWVTILFTIFILYNWYWYLIPLIPFVIYPFAWSGHYFFENNKPAAFHNPIQAKISDWRMFFDILRGKVKI